MLFNLLYPNTRLKKGALLLVISRFISLSHVQLPRKGFQLSLRAGAAFYPLKPGGSTTVSHLFNPVTELQAGIHANHVIINMGLFYFSGSYSYQNHI